MHTFATLANPQTTYLASDAAGPQVLVGRLVANTELLRALVRHARFERFAFFVGESRELAEVEQLARQIDLAPERLWIRPLLELPERMRRGELGVLHHPSHVDAFVDLIALRDRHAAGPLPITGQIHSLSYPRLLGSHALALLHPPSSCDAIFCSSEAGRAAVVRSFAAAGEHLRRAGARVPDGLACELPVIPLGVDVDELRGGARAETRERLGFAADDVVLLVLGRFSEYDKMDLLPLLGVVRDVAARARSCVRLVLAGARQGTKTPELLELWAKVLGIDARVRVLVDVTAADKRDLLAAADLFVSPSDNVQETFGLAVVEAMAAGLPVVASDFDGYRDTVDDTVGVRVPTRWGADPGWLAAYGSLLYERPLHLLLGQSLLVDGRGLGAALSALVDDPRRRAALGARAALRARARFDWRAIVPQYEAVWRRLRERPREVPSDVGPLGLDFSRVFAGHPSAPPLGDDAPLRRAALADWLAERGGRYPVYPDLKNLIGDAEIHGVLRIADAPVSLGELRRAAQGLLADVPLGAVRADLLIGWLLKHGLIEPNE